MPSHLQLCFKEESLNLFTSDGMAEVCEGAYCCGRSYRCRILALADWKAIVLALCDYMYLFAPARSHFSPLLLASEEQPRCDCHAPRLR